MNVKTLINKVVKICKDKIELTDVQVQFTLDLKTKKERIEIIVFFLKENRYDNFHCVIYSELTDEYNIGYLLKQVELNLEKEAKKTSINSFNL